PLIPFICEEIWQKLPAHPSWDRPQSLVIANFPRSDLLPSFPTEHQRWSEIQQLIASVRSLRTQAGVPPKETLAISVNCQDDFAATLNASLAWIKRLAKVSSLQAGSS